MRQQVIATLGRFGDLQASGQLDAPVALGGAVRSQGDDAQCGRRRPAINGGAPHRAGAGVPAIVEETGCRAVIDDLAGVRGHKFALERAVFLTVLHRLFVSGSPTVPRIAGVRTTCSPAWRGSIFIIFIGRWAMAWLGEELPAKEQDGRTPFAPRCLKDVMRFAHRRNLFTRLDLMFMDTTGLYFEGAGGQTLGQHGR